MQAMDEALPEVKQAAEVLRRLEEQGLAEAAIAGGWTRSLVINSTTHDIDVSYVGPIHYEEAQSILTTVLNELQIDDSKWDIEGIWNAELAYGVKSIVENFLLRYLNSIDSIYLASDGKLHDPTRHGFEDAATKTLRINEYDLQGRTPGANDKVYVCLENCRRIAKFQWHLTERSEKRIKDGVACWDSLSENEKIYFLKRLDSKYEPKEIDEAKRVYSQYGWGFVFDKLNI